MATLDQVRSLLKEVAPLLRVLEVREFSADHWSILFAEDLQVEIDRDIHQDKLTLCVELGTPSEENRLTTYETVLLYNFLYKETGGVHLALDALKGNLVQLFALISTDLDVSRLALVLSNFIERARLWRNLISSGGIKPETIRETSALDEELLAGIRI